MSTKQEIDHDKRKFIFKETCNYFAQNPVETIRHVAERNFSTWKKRVVQMKQHNPQYKTNAIYCEESDGLQVAYLLTRLYGETVAVLNFANAYRFGGGVKMGAGAQEENMFRRTDCYVSRKANETDSNDRYCQERTNELNAKHGMVVVDTGQHRVCIRDQEDELKNDLGYHFLSQTEIFPFIELRAAAKDLRGSENSMSESDFKRDCRNRIQAQFATLITNNIRHVVLGAFGCGAFQNNPEIVAQMYIETLIEYNTKFDVVAFAIIKSQANINAFLLAARKNLFMFDSLSSDLDRQNLGYLIPKLHYNVSGMAVISKQIAGVGVSGIHHLQNVTQPMIYLSELQRPVILKMDSMLLDSYKDILPCWVPATVIATAFGHDISGIASAQESLCGEPYLWATEFENVHLNWIFEEPRVTINNRTYRDSEKYFQSQKPVPFVAAVWNTMRVDVMRTALKYKFSNTAALKKLLISTFPYRLLSVKRDPFWGFHPVDGGENMLGALLQELRDTFIQTKEIDSQVKSIQNRIVGNSKLDQIMQHINVRFDLLEHILNKNSEVKVIIAGMSGKIGENGDLQGGYAKNGHQLGTGFAKRQWNDDASWKSSIRLTNDRVARLLTRYPGKIFIGNVGYKTEGTFSVQTLPGPNCIHVWGANAANWNIAPGGIIKGGGQAAAMGKHVQHLGSFGIVTTPCEGLLGLLDTDKTHHNAKPLE